MKGLSVIGRALKRPFRRLIQMKRSGTLRHAFKGLPPGTLLTTVSGHKVIFVHCKEAVVGVFLGDPYTAVHWHLNGCWNRHTFCGNDLIPPKLKDAERLIERLPDDIKPEG